MRVFDGSLDPVDAAAFALGFLLYIQRFFNPVRDIVLQYTQLQRAMAGAHRIFEVLDTRPVIYDKSGAHEFEKIEVDRIVGYGGKDWFYNQLQEILAF